MKLKTSLRIIEGIRSGTKGQDARMIGEFLKMAKWPCEIKKVTKPPKPPKDNKEVFLRYFLRSKNRFIHISAHGGKDSLSLEDRCKTNITVDDIQRFCEKNSVSSESLKHRFVTMSACGHISNSFAIKLNEITSVTAVVSPLTPIHYSESALFSTMFYFSLARFPHLSRHSMDKTDETETKTSGRIAQYIDSFQMAKLAYLTIGGTGAHRLDYWWGDKHFSIH